MGDPVPAAAPLAGVRVVTTRGASKEDRLRALLEAAGAEVLAWPTSEYPPPRDPRPLEAARARLDRFDWAVFTSARAVAAMGEGPADRPTGSAGDGAGAVAGGTAPAAGRPAPTPRVAAVGPATARAATEAGWTVAVEGRGPGARGLAAQVAATFPLAGARALFPAASGAAPTVEEEFTALGARVTRVEAYRTVVTPPPAARVRADLAAGVAAVTFASPSAVEAVDRALNEVVVAATGDGATGDRAACHSTSREATTPDATRALARALAGIAVVCIGPTTAVALERRGIGNVEVAATATLEGMVEALVAVLRGSRQAAGETGARSDAATGRGGTPRNTLATAGRLPGALP